MATYKLRSFAVDATTAGTRKRLTVANILTPWVMLQALAANSGSIHVGDSTVSATNGINLNVPNMAGADLVTDHVIFDIHPDKISLRDIWIDTSNSGDDVMVTYLERVED